MITVEVTKEGAYIEAGGNVEAIPVGTELKFEGEEVPSFLVNKCRVVGTTKDKKLEVAKPKAE